MNVKSLLYCVFHGNKVVHAVTARKVYCL